MSDPHSVLTEQDYDLLQAALQEVNRLLASVRAKLDEIETAQYPDGKRPKGGNGK